MLKNKHVIIALIVAPVLAVIAYFAVDRLVGEQAMPAQLGVDYPLLTQSNCRYASGRCVLYNSEFKVLIVSQSIPGQGYRLVLTSEFALNGVKALVTESSNTLMPPRDWQIEDALGKQWALTVGGSDLSEKVLLLVIDAQGSRYFAETSLAFLNYEPGFDKDFRRSE